MRAVVLLREQPVYRKGSFLAGLQACGYSVVSEIAAPGPADVLVIWNRYGHWAQLASRYEARGARVVVAENGYVGREWRGGVWYQLALGWNNGAGRWPVGDPARAAIFSEELKPWRVGGDYVLVLAQRGIGSPPVAQPLGWHERAVADLERAGHRVVLRGHPGNHQENPSLYAQLEQASCAVTWGSGAGVKALLHGVPVYHGLVCWIGAPAARAYQKPLPEPLRGDRSVMLTRMAWAMWSVEEIASGEAFRHLLGLR